MNKKLQALFMFYSLLFMGMNINNANAIPESLEHNSNRLTTTEVIFNELQKSEISLPSVEAFSAAIKGFSNLKKGSEKITKNILSIVDFSLPSTKKRFWVIDLETKKVLFNDYVAHGRNSGNNIAKKFSNVPSSYSSSLGFYITAETYQGKHGLSMRLDGIDKGFNDNARARAIVVHGADYVSHDFIKKHGRLGRSLGCPSLPMDVNKKVIDTINGGSVFFIYSKDANFLTRSEILNPTTAMPATKG
ncbi:murein L,D-transpeptidase catalytic domain family protein [Draconibacterium halophilum]|uniref:Murein L,D-transpeptidase catalytic domain family protein n=1 Tax=Draconibacterium halophilum TaxID=2706887 RepID=A0A6C0RHE9_9BACT|nr:murein L,D-transpeptidase catalytic domain family protein [Draconibacterium halophilum]QIA09467.1 murein L,D-transpeptidase catalytic domain family protein [Draconibacterium halophilum]